MRAMMFGAAALSVLMLAGAAQAGDVVITATGVQARGGTLYAALQSRDQFMQPTATRGAVRENPAAGTVELVFRDVPPGDYAVSLLHDEDGDRQMDMANNLPSEGYGIVRGETLRAQPTFDDVRVTVPAAGARLSTAIVYMDGRLPTR